MISKEQIEAELAELRKIPEEQRAPSVTKRLEMLQDTQMILSMSGTEREDVSV